MNRIFSRRRLGEDRLGRVVRLAASILFAAGLALGIFAVGADTISPSQNHNSGVLPEFPANAGTHVTPADLESALNFQNGKEIPAQTEVGSPQIPAAAHGAAATVSAPACGRRSGVAKHNLRGRSGPAIGHARA